MRGRGEPALWSWTGAAVALALVTAALWSWSAADQFVSTASLSSAQILGTNALMAIGVGLVVWALGRFLLRRRWPGVPAAFIAVAAASSFALLTLSPGVSRLAWIVLAVLIAACATVIAGLGWPMLRRRSPSLGRTRPSLVAGAVLVLGAVLGWLVLPTGSPPPPVDEAYDGVQVGDDLAQPGPFEVRTFAYGSGVDRLREQYRDPAVHAPVVDLSATVTTWPASRTQRWGFDATQIPLNARVWYPSGAGPFPLVLLVHGNTSSVEFSEEGLGYLGEHLASHGVIAASIDENFLNTTLLDSAGGAEGADLARAVLILEHLDFWRAQADSDLGPLTGGVDLSRIGVLGHSRGGEAAAVAAHLNAQRDDPQSIVAVMALAPSEGQIFRDEQPIVLQDVSYLVLHGSHDVDVGSFAGSSQYARVVPGRNGLKAALYVGGGNHSQFNASWGRRDIGNGLPKLFIDTGALISPEDQQRVARGYVTAFAGTALLGAEHRALLQDHRAGRSWLPQTRYISAYADGGAQVLYDAQGSSLWPCIEVFGSAAAREHDLPLRRGASDNRALEVTAAGGAPDGADPDGADGGVWLRGGEQVSLSESGVLSLDVSVASGTTAQAIQVVVADATGAEATIDLPAAVPAPIGGQPLKLSWMRPGSPVEPVLQTVRIPAEQLAGLDLESLAAVSVRSPATASGLYVDNVVVHPGEETTGGPASARQC
ncbi:MAG: alpha/beta hydrolase [Actinomycetia bacterium]|nr:alpha/beta hydrolase [Actinomycetes bacterium]